MNRNFNLPRLTESQKNAPFAFGEKTKAGTGCNLIIAASMCEGELTKAILMNLADVIETVGITDEEMEQLLYQVRAEAAQNITNMERDMRGGPGRSPARFLGEILPGRRSLRRSEMTCVESLFEGCAMLNT